LLSDPDLEIDWKIPEELRIISAKDTKHPKMAEFDSPF
jgi:dTDP-4-dehydrorhamnose 3,5-epimerase-like enzyme